MAFIWPIDPWHSHVIFANAAFYASGTFFLFRWCGDGGGGRAAVVIAYCNRVSSCTKSERTNHKRHCSFQFVSTCWWWYRVCNTYSFCYVLDYCCMYILIALCTVHLFRLLFFHSDLCLYNMHWVARKPFHYYSYYYYS